MVVGVVAKEKRSKAILSSLARRDGLPPHPHFVNSHAITHLGPSTARRATKAGVKGKTWAASGDGRKWKTRRTRGEGRRRRKGRREAADASGSGEGASPPRWMAHC